MVLDLTVYVTNVISFFYNKQKGKDSDILNFSGKKL